MKTIACILFFSCAAAAAVAEEVSPASPYSANDMDAPTALLYPGTVAQRSLATPSKSRQEVREDVLRGRRRGTPIEYANVSSYEASISWRPFLPQPERSDRKLSDSLSEYRASRLAGTPAAYSNLETYEMRQAYPGMVR